MFKDVPHTVAECLAMAAASRRLVSESRRLLELLAESKHAGGRRWHSIASGHSVEVRYWTAILGCTKAELASVISVSGVMVEDVRKELKRRRALLAAEQMLPTRDV